MWVSPKLFNLPRTKKSFYLTSRNGEKFVVKPGKAFLYKNNTWNLVRAVGNLNNKISRVIVSPTGNMSLHLPKMTGLLATHQNVSDTIVITLPLPSSARVSKDSPITALDTIAPTGEGLIVTTPHKTVGDIPFIFGLQNKKMSDFPQHVHGMATSENGQAVALAVDDQLWIWQQLPEYEKGIGFWTDLTANRRFSIAVESNHPLSQQGRVFHGYTKPQQYFTLHPALAPNLPQNSAISYQDLVMFDNPDEGRGVCCLTSLLPPCKPFDTLYLFNSICTFKGLKPVFQRAETLLPVVDDHIGPCIWWSRDCRLAVVAVGSNLLIVTRFLRTIAVVPLSEIFPGDQPIVADVAWSCGGQFFILTSTLGKIGAVTRSGKSMKHQICSLTPFGDKNIPLKVSADSKDPGLFNIYSSDKFRELKIETDMVPQTLENLMSLHFPQKYVYYLWDRTIKEINTTGFANLQNFIKLLYLTDLFRIWPYQSPLRYWLFQIFDAGINHLLETNHDLYAFLLARCIFRLTETPVSAYQSIVDRLNISEKKRDKMLSRIMQDELDKKDYVLVADIDKTDRIKMYQPTEEDLEQMKKLQQPHNGRNVDIFSFVKAVKNLLYSPDFDPEIFESNVNVALLMEIMVQFGKFDRAILLAKHCSIANDPSTLFQRIAALHPNEPGLLFRAMQVCIQASPEDEANIRAICVNALTNILKQRIAESSPTAKNLRTKCLSSIVTIEEDLVLVVPENSKQLEDFAIILGMAFAAADYPACSNYFNGRSNLTSEFLRHVVRELFSIVWFIRWRQAAIIDTAKTGHATSATLRLLAFPDFVNQKVAKSQIFATGEGMFPPDVYVLYMNSGSNPIFEKDPIFPDFAAECSNRISPRALSRITAQVMQLTENDDDIPNSKLLFATIVSHMIPWLRCGIPRAMSGFKCADVVPNELLDLEDLVLPRAIPPQMKLQTNVLYNDDIFEEEEEEPEIPPPIPEPVPLPESSSEGEFIPEPEPEPEPKPKPKPRKKKPQKKPKIRKKPEKPPPPRGPRLRLLTLDPNPPPRIPQPQQYYIPQPQMPYMPQMPTNPYQPIWDYDPSKWQPKPPPPPPKEEEPPVKQEPEPPRVRPVIIVNSKQKKPKHDDLDISSSSDISDIPLSQPRRGPVRPADGFPLDEGLHKRIELLLDEASKAPDPRELEQVEAFKRPSMKRPEKKKRPPPEPAPIEEPPDPGARQPPKKEEKEWRPSLVSMRRPQVIGIQEITAEEFMTGQGYSKGNLRLKEIHPEDESE